MGAKPSVHGYFGQCALGRWALGRVSRSSPGPRSSPPSPIRTFSPSLLPPVFPVRHHFSPVASPNSRWSLDRSLRRRLIVPSFLVPFSASTPCSAADVAQSLECPSTFFCAEFEMPYSSGTLTLFTCAEHCLSSAPSGLSLGLSLLHLFSLPSRSYNEAVRVRQHRE
ncbi:hypothetical protein CPAR01_00758 [Colletotrichum paranaense]|uniref:Uncharacterized protein n=1 Tax=Colletotrichum paranaense TaxID=1914294 RepID=A0ABQ9T4W1_9PEZI|nr:uncharacterized protein CPAR01_00758 [Colletotrichum paranaense]KAK1546791.1 hypothetical protein CPAR01_00758 [Colletotrichum paranaense]